METTGRGTVKMIERVTASQKMNKTLQRAFIDLGFDRILVLTTESGTQYGLLRDPDEGNLLGRKDATTGKTTWSKLGLWSILPGCIFKNDSWTTTKVVSWEIRPKKKNPPRKTIKVGTTALKFQPPQV